VNRKSFFPFRVVAPVLLLTASACSTGRAPRAFAPANASDAQEVREALEAVARRASTLGASRLLYDAKMSGGAGPAVPGTLAVTYDGRIVERAFLTGPFGAKVAQVDGGAVTGEDRRALLVEDDVEPGEVLRGILAGAWPGEPAIEGCDGAECRVSWDAAMRVSAIVDRTTRRLSELVLTGRGGTIVVTYGGDADPWPARVAAREESSGRGLKLSLVAVEPETPAP
jgi:hypothetical protein